MPYSRFHERGWSLLANPAVDLLYFQLMPVQKTLVNGSQADISYGSLHG
jgi:hypothetical protein